MAWACLSEEPPSRPHVLGLRLGRKEDILDPLPLDLGSLAEKHITGLRLTGPEIDWPEGDWS